MKVNIPVFNAGVCEAYKAYELNDEKTKYYDPSWGWITIPKKTVKHILK